MLTALQKTHKAAHVQECDKDLRIIHMFADHLLLSPLFTSILSSPASCTLTPPPPFTYIHVQVGGCLVYKNQDNLLHMRHRNA